MNYEIKERLSEEELHRKIEVLNKKYAGKTYKHKNGNGYQVHGATVINKDGTAYWGLIYHAYNEDGFLDRLVPHTRTLDEFLDGRFTLVQ